MKSPTPRINHVRPALVWQLQMTRKEALAICGPLSDPDKMPGHGYALPASACRLGSLLRHVRGSVCYCCYARRGRYVYPAVKNAMQKRFSSIFHPQWVDAASTLIQCSGDRYFRWHDSGDLQGSVHLRNIIAVCRSLPNVKFWLPTREYQTVEAYRKIGGELPPNLCVRYSAHFVDGPPPLRYGMPISTVSSSTRHTWTQGTYQCPALQQGSRCGACRTCWDRSVRIVDYPLRWAVRQTSGKTKSYKLVALFVIVATYSSTGEGAMCSAQTFRYCWRSARIWMAKSSKCLFSPRGSEAGSLTCFRCSCKSRFRKK